ncbi:hypothetical protein B0H10DRAFT_2190061 [Mycena sp. CBHHK59/15]|nr:hypothetical protein B0H10DRAFT_2190061 [Mycena sp. CBHHK59/15]
MVFSTPVTQRAAEAQFQTEEGFVDALVREFINTEDWYVEEGIPHRRGYLLNDIRVTYANSHRAPSTIYALAGVLNLEIYSLSLASGFAPRPRLKSTRPSSSRPSTTRSCVKTGRRRARGVWRDAAGRAEGMMKPVASKREGKLFFTTGYPSLPRELDLPSASSLIPCIPSCPITPSPGPSDHSSLCSTVVALRLTPPQTNYVDRLEPALLRPGRIDRKVAYGLTTAESACTLFLRFFPSERFLDVMEPPSAFVDSVAKAKADGDVKISTANATDREATGHSEDSKISGGETKPSPPHAKPSPRSGASPPTSRLQSSQRRSYSATCRATKCARRRRSWTLRRRRSATAARAAGADGGGMGMQTRPMPMQAPAAVGGAGGPAVEPASAREEGRAKAALAGNIDIDCQLTCGLEATFLFLAASLFSKTRQPYISGCGEVSGICKPLNSTPSGDGDAGE